MKTLPGRRVFWPLNWCAALLIAGLAFASSDSQGKAAEPTPTMATGPVQAPLEIVNGKIVLDMTINGLPARVILDSAGAGVLIDTKFAARAKVGKPLVLGFQPRANGLKTGAGSKTWFAFGKENVLQPSPLLVDLSAQGLKNIDALVGADLFQDWVVELDFDNKRLTLHDRAAFRPPADLTPLSLLVSDKRHPTVSVGIEGQPFGVATLDTGSSVPVMLNSEVAAPLQMDGRKRSTTFGGGGIGQSNREWGIFSLSDLTVGPYRLNSVPANVAPPDEKVFTGPVIIGLPVLQRFHSWWDLRGGKLWLTPTKAIGDPFLRSTTGWWIRTSGEVIGVDPNSPAQAAGLKKGDRVVSVNGVPVAQYFSVSRTGSLEPVTLILSDKRQLHVQPAIYY